MEVGGIRIPLQEPFLVTPMSPDNLLTLVDLHERVLKSITLKPLFSAQAIRISYAVISLDLFQEVTLPMAEVRPKVAPSPS
jgi:hypothetical protein